MTGLQAALEELERTDPAVAEAAKRYDDAVASLLTRSRAGVGTWCLRLGRKVPQHVYLQLGPTPTDDDEPLFTAPSAAIASLIVIATNEHLARTRGTC